MSGRAASEQTWSRGVLVVGPSIGHARKINQECQIEIVLSTYKFDEAHSRNKPGAVLLTQIFGQFDKTALRTVLVICPSPVNQDVQEREEVRFSAFGKELCFLDADDLGRLMLDFEKQTKFDRIDLDELYKTSRTKKRSKKTAPDLCRF